MPRGIPKNPATAKLTGPHANFRHKVKKATSVSLTQTIIDIADRNQMRLGCSRSDFVCRLIEQYGDVVSFDERGT